MYKEKKGIAQATILMQAFSITCSDFHMEKTAYMFLGVFLID